MRKLLWIVVFVAIAAVGIAEELEEPADFQLIIGPRIGINYIFTTSAEFTNGVNDLGIFPAGTYYPVTSLFGIIAEQRILLGQTRSHFAFQEVVLVSGLEQSLAIPSGSLLIGYRDASGFEVGFGPTLSISGIGVIIAVGYTISFQGVFVPLDISVVLPNSQRPISVALTTGFNFITRTRRGTF